MKNKIVPIILSIMLVIALAGNIILFNKLVKAQENSNDYQEAMSQLVIMKTDLDNANETIATLQNEITDMENVISTNTMEDREEEITAEMLEGLSAELNEEQQAAATDKDIPVNKDTENKNGNNGNNSSQQQQSNPDIDAWMKEMIENGVPTTLPPVTAPEHEFGENHDGIHGAIAQ